MIDRIEAAELSQLEGVALLKELQTMHLVEIRVMCRTGPQSNGANPGV